MLSQKKRGRPGIFLAFRVVNKEVLSGNLNSMCSIKNVKVCGGVEK